MSFSRFSQKRPTHAACNCCEKPKPRDEFDAQSKREKRCAACVEAGCTEGFAAFWKRGETCPVRRRARRGASCIPKKARAT